MYVHIDVLPYWQSRLEDGYGRGLRLVLCVSARTFCSTCPGSPGQIFVPSAVA